MLSNKGKGEDNIAARTPSNAVKNFKKQPVPKTSVTTKIFEPIEHRSLTKVDLSSIAAQGLRRKIDELKFPQATEETDSKALNELIGLLENLLTKEALLAPAQGTRTAKEYIVKLKRRTLG